MQAIRSVNVGMQSTFRSLPQKERKTSRPGRINETGPKKKNLGYLSVWLYCFSLASRLQLRAADEVHGVISNAHVWISGTTYLGVFRRNWNKTYSTYMHRAAGNWMLGTNRSILKVKGNTLGSAWAVLDGSFTASAVVNPGSTFTDHQGWPFSLLWFGFSSPTMSFLGEIN